MTATLSTAAPGTARPENTENRRGSRRGRRPRVARTGRFATLLLALLTPAPVSAQLEELHDDWRRVPFTAASGLPSQLVREVVETTDGVIWVLTADGLAWYDDFRWHPMRLPDRRSPRSLLVADRDGGVLTTIEGRLYRGDERGLAHVPVELEGRVLGVHGVQPLEPGDALLLLTSSGLFRLDEQGLEPFASPVPDATVAGKLVRTALGSVWMLVSTPGGGVFEWGGDRWLERLTLGDHQLHVDRHGGLVAVDTQPHRNGLWSWSRERPEPERLADEEAGSRCLAVAVGPEGEAIVVYASGRVRVRQEGEWSWLEQVPLWLQTADLLRFQSNGDLWSANEDGLSLHRLSSRRWTRRSWDEPSANEINAIQPTPAGDLWLGTPDGIFVHGSDGGVEHVETVLQVPLGIVTGLLLDRSGAMWVSSGADFPGAFRWRDGVWRHYGAAQGLDAERVHRIVADRDGHLWFLGISEDYHDEGPGAFVFDGERFTPWGVPEGLRDGRTYAFADGEDGARWFGTRGHLSRWREGTWKHWDLGTARVFTIAIVDGRVWFGCQGSPAGLGYVDEEDRLRYLTRDDGLVDDRVMELRGGADGSLWIATAGGVGRYREGAFASFDRTSGLLHPRVWPLHVTDDRVYVGTNGGGLFELGLDEADEAPLVELWDPLVDTERALFRWEVFPFRGSPLLTETRHRLDGSPWSPWSRAREANLLRPTPGEHTFEVEARSLYGASSSGAVAFTHRVPPPLHRHPLVLAGGALWLATMGGVAFLYVRRRQRHVRLLRASERRLRTLIDEIPICIHEIDLEGRLVSMNPAGLCMLGLTDEAQVVGLAYLQAVADEDRERVGVLLDEARRGKASEFTFRSIDMQGRVRVFASTFVPLRGEAGEVVRLMGYTQDITDARRAEERRRDLEAELRQAQKMEAIGQLAGGVAHDFNNLLTVINGHAGFIRDDPGNLAGVLESVGQLARAADQAASLTGQLLAFSRRQVLQQAVLDVARVVAGVERMLRRLIREELELEVDVPVDVGCVRGDRVQLEQVIINLVVNAQDAIVERGKIRVAAYDRTLDAPLRSGATEVPIGRYVVVEVTDTGRGIDVETQHRIFEPFFTTKPLQQGTGLGLSTVFGIVLQSSGFVLVDSEPGRGARFSVFLPRVEAAPAPPEKGRDRRADRRGWETILVAEDSEEIREMICHLLERQGYTTLAARDGAEGVEVAKRHADAIDLLLTDLIMPHLNGDELARHVLELQPRAAVVYMSGYADRAILDQIEPASTLLAKPFQPSSLLARVRSALDERPRPSAEATATRASPTP